MECRGATDWLVDAEAEASILWPPEHTIFFDHCGKLIMRMIELLTGFSGKKAKGRVSFD